MWVGFSFKDTDNSQQSIYCFHMVAIIQTFDLKDSLKISTMSISTAAHFYTIKEILEWELVFVYMDIIYLIVDDTLDVRCEFLTTKRLI